MRRIKLSFVPGLEVEFSDRDRAIRQVYEFAEKGTRFPIVIYGPEGCGKTSLLLQAIEILKEMGYSIIYFNPLRRRFEAEAGIESIRQMILDRLKRVSAEYEFARLIWSVVDLVIEVLKLGKKRLAIVVDDAFQYLDPREAATVVKSLLEIIEHPEENYERIVVIVATSEGLSRFEIGRHRWGELIPMWNMSRKGFEELYEKLPRPKPSFEDVWRFTGGNPYMLSLLYRYSWRVDTVISIIVSEKGLTRWFVGLWREWLEKVVEDPDTVSDPGFPQELRDELVKRNLIVHHLRVRDPELWIDEPPPERDPEIGVGKENAWQIPLYREAVKRVLAKAKPS
jgi:GTPase SAR1 family protein